MLTASCHIKPSDITTAALRAGGQVELTHVTTLVAACLQPEPRYNPSDADRGG